MRPYTHGINSWKIMSCQYYKSEIWSYTDKSRSKSHLSIRSQYEVYINGTSEHATHWTPFRKGNKVNRRYNFQLSVVCHVLSIKHVLQNDLASTKQVLSESYKKKKKNQLKSGTHVMGQTIRAKIAVNIYTLYLTPTLYCRQGKPVSPRAAQLKRCLVALYCTTKQFCRVQNMNHSATFSFSLQLHKKVAFLPFSLLPLGWS